MYQIKICQNSSASPVPVKFTGLRPYPPSALLPGTIVRLKPCQCAYVLPNGLEPDDMATIVDFDIGNYLVDAKGRNWIVSTSCIAAHQDLKTGEWIDGGNPRKQNDLRKLRKSAPPVNDLGPLRAFTKKTHDEYERLDHAYKRPAGKVDRLFASTYGEATRLGFIGHMGAWKWCVKHSNTTR